MDQKELQRFRSECLAAHNYYRSLHRTPPLVWNSSLADSAQSWADQLARSDCLKYSNEKGIGENIACCWGSHLTGFKATQIWYEEKEYFDYESLYITPRTRPFCQIIWQGTKQLGAAKAKTVHGKELVVARYKPSTTRENVAQNIRTPTTEKKPVHEQSSQAQRLTCFAGLRQFQEECLLAHNEYRFRHGVPPLRWSFQLSWEAQQWAEELAKDGELKHNKDDSVGENLAGMLGDELSGREATDMWYNEIEDYDFDSPGYGEDTSNFTQVVWATSENFGVGRAVEGDLSVVVAFYDPPGNREDCFGQNVFRVGSIKNSTKKKRRKMSGPNLPVPDVEMFRIECLATHNFYRARHGSPPLILTSTLTNEAQYWAERLLVTGTREDLENSRIGVSVAFLEWKHVSGITLTEMWYSQIYNYNFESPGFNSEVKNFTQLVWNSTRRFGIGKADDGNGFTVVVARYEPVGNIDGLFVSNVSKKGFDRVGCEPNHVNIDVVAYKLPVAKSASSFLSWENEGTEVIGVDTHVVRSSLQDWNKTELCPRTSADFLLNRLLQDLDATRTACVDLLNHEREQQTNWSSPSLSLASSLSMSDLDENSNSVSKYHEEVKRQSSTDQFTQLVWIDGTESPRVEEPAICQEQCNDVSMEDVTEQQPTENDEKEPSEVDVQEADLFSEPEAKSSPHDFQCPRPQSICSDIVEIKPGSVLSKISFWEQLSQEGSRGSQVYEDEIENVSPAITSEDDYTEEEEEDNSVDEYQPIETIPEVDEQELEYEDVFPAHVEETDLYSPVESEDNDEDQQFSETRTEGLEARSDQLYSELVDNSDVIYQTQNAVESDADENVQDPEDIFSSEMESALEHQESDESKEESEQSELVNSGEERKRIFESAPATVLVPSLLTETESRVKEDSSSDCLVENNYDMPKKTNFDVSFTRPISVNNFTSPERKTEEVQVPSDLCDYVTLDRDRTKKKYFEDIANRLELVTVKTNELPTSSQQLESGKDDIDEEKESIIPTLQRKSLVCEETFVASTKTEVESELDFDDLFETLETVSCDEGVTNAKIDAKLCAEADFKKELLEDIADKKVMEHVEVTSLKEAPLISVSDEELVEYGESESEDDSDDVFIKPTAVKIPTATESTDFATRYKVHERTEDTTVIKVCTPKANSAEYQEIDSEDTSKLVSSVNSREEESIEKREELPMLHLADKFSSNDSLEHVTPENINDEVDVEETIEDDSVYMSEFRVREAHSPAKRANEADTFSVELEQQVKNLVSDTEEQQEAHLKQDEVDRKVKEHEFEQRTVSPSHEKIDLENHPPFQKVRSIEHTDPFDEDQPQSEVEILNKSDFAETSEEFAKEYPDVEEASVRKRPLSLVHIAAEVLEKQIEEQQDLIDYEKTQELKSVEDINLFEQNEKGTSTLETFEDNEPIEQEKAIDEACLVTQPAAEIEKPKTIFSDISSKGDEQSTITNEDQEFQERQIYAVESHEKRLCVSGVPEQSDSTVSYKEEHVQELENAEQQELSITVAENSLQELEQPESIICFSDEKEEIRQTSFDNLSVSTNIAAVLENYEDNFQDFDVKPRDDLESAASFKENETHQHENLVKEAEDTPSRVSGVIEKRANKYDELRTDSPEQLEPEASDSEKEARVEEKSFTDIDVTTVTAVLENRAKDYEDLDIKASDELESAVSFEEDKTQEPQISPEEADSISSNVFAVIEKRQTIHDELRTESSEQLESVVCESDEEAEVEEKSFTDINVTTVTPVLENREKNYKDVDIKASEELESAVSFEEDEAQEHQTSTEEADSESTNAFPVPEKRQTMHDELRTESPEQLESVVCESVEEAEVEEQSFTDIDVTTVTAVLENREKESQDSDIKASEELESAVSFEEDKTQEHQTSAEEADSVSSNVFEVVDNRQTKYDELRTESPEQLESVVCESDEEAKVEEHSFTDIDVAADVTAALENPEKDFEDSDIKASEELESAASFPEDETQEHKKSVKEADSMSSNVFAVIEKRQTIHDELRTESPEQLYTVVCESEQEAKVDEQSFKDIDVTTVTAVLESGEKDVEDADLNASEELESAASFPEDETEEHQTSVEEFDGISSNVFAVIKKQQSMYDEFRTERSEQLKSVVCESDEEAKIEEQSFTDIDVAANVTAVLENPEKDFEDSDTKASEELESAVSFEKDETQDHEKSVEGADSMSSNVFAVIEKRRTMYDELRTESFEQLESVVCESVEEAEVEEQSFTDIDVTTVTAVLENREKESEDSDIKASDELESAVSFEDDKTQKHQTPVEEADNISSNVFAVTEKRRTMYDELRTESPEQLQSAICESDEETKVEEQSFTNIDVTTVTAVLENREKESQDSDIKAGEELESAVSFEEGKTQEHQTSAEETDRVSSNVFDVVEKRQTKYDELRSKNPEQLESVVCEPDEEAKVKEHSFAEIDVTAVTDVLENCKQGFEDSDIKHSEEPESAESFEKDETQEHKKSVKEADSMSSNVFAVIEKRQTIHDELRTESPEQLNTVVCESEQEAKVDEQSFKDIDVTTVTAVLESGEKDVEDADLNASEELESAASFPEDETEEHQLKSAVSFEEDKPQEHQTSVEGADSVSSNVFDVIEKRRAMYDELRSESPEQLESMVCESDEEAKVDEQSFTDIDVTANVTEEDETQEHEKSVELADSMSSNVFAVIEKRQTKYDELKAENLEELKSVFCESDEEAKIDEQSFTDINVTTVTTALENRQKDFEDSDIKASEELELAVSLEEDEIEEHQTSVKEFDGISSNVFALIEKRQSKYDELRSESPEQLESVVCESDEEAKIEEQSFTDTDVTTNVSAVLENREKDYEDVDIKNSEELESAVSLEEDEKQEHHTSAEEANSISSNIFAVIEKRQTMYDELRAENPEHLESVVCEWEEEASVEEKTLTNIGITNVAVVIENRDNHCYEAKNELDSEFFVEEGKAQEIAVSFEEPKRETAYERFQIEQSESSLYYRQHKPEEKERSQAVNSAMFVAKDGNEDVANEEPVEKDSENPLQIKTINVETFSEKESASTDTEEREVDPSTHEIEDITVIKEVIESDVYSSTVNEAADFQKAFKFATVEQLEKRESLQTPLQAICDFELQNELQEKQVEIEIQEISEVGSCTKQRLLSSDLSTEVCVGSPIHMSTDLDEFDELSEENGREKEEEENVKEPPEKWESHEVKQEYADIKSEEDVGECIYKEEVEVEFIKESESCDQGEKKDNEKESKLEPVDCSPSKDAKEKEPQVFVEVLPIEPEEIVKDERIDLQSEARAFEEQVEVDIKQHLSLEELNQEDLDDNVFEEEVEIIRLPQLVHYEEKSETEGEVFEEEVEVCRVKAGSDQSQTEQANKIKDQVLKTQDLFEEAIEVHNIPSESSEQYQEFISEEAIQEKVKMIESQQICSEQKIKNETKQEKETIAVKHNGHVFDEGTVYPDGNTKVAQSMILETPCTKNIYEEEVDVHQVECQIPENAELDTYEEEVEVPGYEKLFQDEPRRIIHPYREESDSEPELVPEDVHEEFESEEKDLTDVSEDEVEENKEEFEECQIFIECTKADVVSKKCEEAYEFTPVSPPAVPTAFEEVCESEPEDTIEATIERVAHFKEYKEPTDVEDKSLVIPQTMIVMDNTQCTQAEDINILFEEKSLKNGKPKYFEESASSDEKEVVFEKSEKQDPLIILQPFEPEADISEYVESIEDGETTRTFQTEDHTEEELDVATEDFETFETMQQNGKAVTKPLYLGDDESRLEHFEKDRHSVTDITPECVTVVSSTSNAEEAIVTNANFTRTTYSSSATIISSQPTTQTFISKQIIQSVSAEDQQQPVDIKLKVKLESEGSVSKPEDVNTKQETVESFRTQQFLFTQSSETTSSSHQEASTVEESDNIESTYEEDKALLERKNISNPPDLTEIGIYEKESQMKERYYVDFSPGGSFEQDSEGHSEEGEVYDHVYIQQGEPLEDDLEEFILVRYGDDYPSSEDDTSDHREIYVIPEEEVVESEEETHEKIPKVVVEHMQFVEEEEENVDKAEGSEKAQVIGESQDDEEVEERSREEVELKEYERLESLVILEDKLSHMESDDDTNEFEIFGKLEPAPPISKSSSEATLQEEEFGETMTGSELSSMIESQEQDSTEILVPRSEGDDDDKHEEAKMEEKPKEKTFQDIEKELETNYSDERYPKSTDSPLGSSEEEEKHKEQQPRSGVLSYQRTLEGKNTWGPILSKRLRTSQSFEDSYSSRSEESFGSEASSHSTPSEDEDMNEFQRHCLKTHNKYRRQHGVLPLTWSPALAAEAEKRAENLATAATQEHCGRRDFGENLFTTKGEPVGGESIVDVWYGEVCDYSFESPAFDARCGSFTQMIWASTRELGVARRTSKDGTQYVVARYHPPGNVVGEFRDNVKPGDVEALIASRRRSSIDERPRRLSRRRRSSRSGSNPNLQHDRETFKRECLITHNYYRSLHEAPPLNWSSVLASEAQKWADQLARTDSFKHSGHKDRGENLAFVWGSNLTPMKATEMWYDEVKEYDFSSPGFSSNTGHFTQVVWVGTEQFGMAKAVGEDGTQIMVGRYYPPGNIVGTFRENVKPNKFGRR